VLIRKRMKAFRGFGQRFAARIPETIKRPFLAMAYLYKFSDIKRGDLVGEDQFGNKYFENRSFPLGRDRWVEFKAKKYDASLVPPEWHAWLHRMTDKPGSEIAKFAHPRTKAEHRPNLTATENRYTPPNFILNNTYVKRQMYDPWTPRSSSQEKQTSMDKVD